jgi:hypothetical protein
MASSYSFHPPLSHEEKQYLRDRQAYTAMMNQQYPSDAIRRAMDFRRSLRGLANAYQQAINAYTVELPISVLLPRQAGGENVVEAKPPHDASQEGGPN